MSAPIRWCNAPPGYLILLQCAAAYARSVRRRLGPVLRLRLCPQNGGMTVYSRCASLPLILCALAGSCTPSPRTNTQLSADSALRQAAAAWANSFTTRDPVTITKHFSNDAVAWFPRGATPTVGSAAIRAAWVNYFKNSSAHPLSIDSVVTAGSGELGLVYGKYLYKPQSDPTADGGRYIALWRPTAAGWRLVLLSAHKHDDVSAAT